MYGHGNRGPLQSVLKRKAEKDAALELDAKVTHYLLRPALLVLESLIPINELVGIGYYGNRASLDPIGVWTHVKSVLLR